LQKLLAKESHVNTSGMTSVDVICFLLERLIVPRFVKVDFQHYAQVICKENLKRVKRKEKSRLFSFLFPEKQGRRKAWRGLIILSSISLLSSNGTLSFPTTSYLGHRPQNNISYERTIAKNLRKLR